MLKGLGFIGSSSWVLSWGVGGCLGLLAVNDEGPKPPKPNLSNSDTRRSLRKLLLILIVVYYTPNPSLIIKAPIFYILLRTLARRRYSVASRGQSSRTTCVFFVGGILLGLWGSRPLGIFGFKGLVRALGL